MFCTAICRKPSASDSALIGAAGGLRARSRPVRRSGRPRRRGPAAGRRPGRTRAGSAPAGSCPAARWRRWWPAGRRGGSWPGRGWRRRFPGRRAAARRRTQDRAAARGHGVDAHHRRAHAHAGHLGLEGALELAGVVADVGRLVPPMSKPITLSWPPATAVRTMPTMPPAGPGQDGVLALEAVRLGQAAADCMKNRRTPGICAPPGRRSGAGSATGRRRPRWCRRATPASSAG
jgi:hypothetical protein